MKAILDAYGGDHAPLEIIKGAALAAQEYAVEIVLTGKVAEMQSVAQQHGISLAGIELVEAASVMPVEANPADILKDYSDSSMAVGLKMLAKGQGDAFISAGSTGALAVGATLLVKRIKGVRRAALATVIPARGGCYMLMDAGANAECRPEMLLQFGVMGSAYMNGILDIKRPRVGLVNIGTEQNKGLELQTKAFELLRDSRLNFIGNIEARQLPLGGCDVAVTDGFTGNIILKLTEGMGSFISRGLKDIFLQNALTKVGALLVKNGIDSFKKQMDYTEYGGAPLMGIAKPVIKAHGSSNALAIKNAVRQAKLYHENKVIQQIQQTLAAPVEGGEN